MTPRRGPGQAEPDNPIARKTRLRASICKGEIIVGISTKPGEPQVRAEASFRKEERAKDGAKAMMEYQANARIAREKMAQLKALRLAKEAAEQAPKPVSKPVSKPAPKLAATSRVKTSSRQPRTDAANSKIISLECSGVIDIARSTGAFARITGVFDGRGPNYAAKSLETNTSLAHMYASSPRGSGGPRGTDSR